MPNLAPKSKCTGCTACYSSCPQKCITMQPDEYGFLYPEINTSVCIECKKCELSCPVIEYEKNKNRPKVYAACALDEDIRGNSSSGGVFSLLANEVLEQKGVVYGAAYDSEYKVKHICIETRDEIHKLRGAKYTQSDLGGCFKEIKQHLNSGRHVMFTGTPCQVAGMKKYLKKSYSNLILVDFVCHGLPSPDAWKEYVKYRAFKDNGGTFPVNINLRSKKSGWSKYRYSNEYIYINGKVYSKLSGEDLYMQLFVGDYINRRSCAECCFKGYDRVADITLGDFWGIWDIEPEMDDDKGTSLILIHSEKANNLLNRIVDKIRMRECSAKQASMRNSSLLYSSPSADKREKVLGLSINGRYDEIACFLKEQENRQSFVQRLRKIAFKILKRASACWEKW